ncbi:1714_t:CDS:2 [Acaulospora morrowiae]|uniref:1714_t:CDS:1 n=1 Tax=Acaulospora morrowiae TaxID=94023 RepID=A0A9N8V4U3_9GLOM|nr:1714_t:CDS:2 [Acaulospora morrowiae]
MDSRIFPLLSPIDLEGLSYRGFITVRGQELPFQIQLENPNSKTLKNAKLYGCPELKRLIHGHENALRQRIEQCTNFSEFFLDLKDLLELIMTKEKPEPMPTGKYYSSLLSEINSIGWDKLETLDPSLKNFFLKLSDSSGRKHSVFISLPFSYPHSPLDAHADLPSTSKAQILATSLKDVINYYSKEFEKFQEVWSMLDDIDANTSVLEPDRPKRSDLMRRIALGNYCSLQIEINTEHPREECQYKLFGTESLIESFHLKIEKNWNNWDTTLTVRQNLEKVFEMTFPSPQVSSSSDVNFDCGICYSYRFEDSIPDRSCSNSKCGKPFHRICLYEWLQAIPSTKKNFQTLIGNCPYCNETITVIREH